ncbi:hypothetical protein [Legionella cincinnatiensis]|uniref:Uncharacterized protein n=1 Tax=Legionella cincinnatiensis TaxID=28085 RepID=A0A378IIA6_9GAMM|nr:hypothetical protein [Legionella cincinnatiensis]KTC83558.1 hypothetical protein Lcin_2245 [Legionella cincinnatiensis]STX34482.1 Uncharacterised protein [Legionella cincinnatiensis]
MYSKHSQFFQNRKEKLPPDIQFFNVIKTPAAIHELYRGFDNLASVIFSLPTLLTGIFGKTYPEMITMEQIKLHKLTNLSNDFHMVSMSEDFEVAFDWGNKCFITIDPTLFRSFAVDIHETYRKNDLNLPGRMEREKEHVALAVLSCSIKKITIHNKEIDNPFYLAISEDNQEAIKAFHDIYGPFVSLLRNKYTKELDVDEEKLALREHVAAYLQFYDKYSGGNNPFNKTYQELVELYPDFMEYFFQLNPHQPKSDLIKNQAMASSDNLFKEHYYTKSIDASFISRAKEATTCYDDEWARPFYE